MATVFKTFLNDDVVTSRTLLHEAIPVTGSLIVSSPEGAYSDPTEPSTNVKTYPHGMFQSVYDYPYASSSANHIFDLTAGVYPDDTAGFYSPDDDPWAVKKRNIYNQMAQVLVGHNAQGEILKFDQDGDFASGGVKYEEVFFVNIARLIAKDEVRKGSFQMKLGIGQPILLHDSDGDGSYDESGTKNADASTPELAQTYVVIGDDGAATDYRVNSPAGEYGILKITGIKYGQDDGGSVSYTDELVEDDLKALYSSDEAPSVGLIYYQAGVVVLDKSLFAVGKLDAPSGKTEYPLSGDLNASGTDEAGVLPYDMFVETATDDGAGGTISTTGLYTSSPFSSFGTGLHWSYDDRSMVEYAAGHIAKYIPGQDPGVTFDSTLLQDWGGALDATDMKAYGSVDEVFKNGSIDHLCTGLRGRIIDISFNNTTELNSTIYFCRVNHNDFNYSSNPTYLGDDTGENHSKIRVKKSTLDAPVTYITTIGLYSADNELLAVAKLSEPLRKDPTNEMTLRVRLDY